MNKKKKNNLDPLMEDCELGGKSNIRLTPSGKRRPKARSAGRGKSNKLADKTVNVVVNVPTAKPDAGDSKPQCPLDLPANVSVTDKPTDSNNNSVIVPNGYIQTPGEPQHLNPLDNSTNIAGRDTNVLPADSNAGGLLRNRRSSSNGSERDKQTVAFQLPKRPKSVGGWSKKDLDIFLPRKSYFNVHDKLLEEAGIDVKSEEERNRKPDWRSLLRMHTMDELFPPRKETENSDKGFIPPVVPDSDEDDDGSNADNVESYMSAHGGKDHGSVQRKPRISKKKITLGSDKEGFKQLLEYLKYISENPDEYINMSQYTHKNTDHKHPDTMVRLGRAFRRGHHCAVRNNIFIHAIAGLKPKYVESGNTSSRQPGAPKVTATKKADESGRATPIVASTSTIERDKNANSDETELEKIKKKTEAWMKTVSTHQFMRAKDLALRELGEEDVNVSKWWVAFQNCHYLRVPKHISGGS